MIQHVMNFSSERKQSMKSLLTVISLALALTTTAYAAIDWGFSTSGGIGNTYLGSDGSSLVTITPGLFGTGWHAVTGALTTPQWANFGSAPGASGLWDLGRPGSGQAGSIVLSSPSWGNGLTTLNVFQWVDTSATYSGELHFAVNNGASTLRSGQFDLLSGLTLSGAGWYEFTADLGALGAGQTVSVTAGSGGAILDRLTLVPEPATMIAGAVLLIPFALSTWPILRRRRTS
jgi:hypothetical protein